MKASTSFLMKGIYLILIFVTIAVVLNQIATLKYENAAQQKELEVRQAANQILEKLITDEKCLAYKDVGVTADERQIPLTTQREIDLRKLDSFATKYTDVEPDCARDYQYRYSIRVDKFNQTRITAEEPTVIPPAGNRDVVLIFDNSGSMCIWNKKGSCVDSTKIVTAKQAAIKFLDCADKTDRLSLVAFGDGETAAHLCDVTEKFPLTEIGENNSANRNMMEGQIMTLSPYFGTPLVKSMQKAADIMNTEANPNRTKMVILMTDGKESCCQECSTTCSCSGCSDKCYQAPCLGRCSCEPECINKICPVAENVMPKGIPIFTIAFDLNEKQGVQELQCVANKTGGKFFSADLNKLGKIFCELGAKKNVTIEEPQTWTFGIESHSIGSALRTSLSISTPVTIRFNETKSQPAVITITIYDGELEEITDAIDSSCTLNTEITTSASFSNPVYAKQLNDRNAICMSSKDGEFCSELSCTKQIHFPSLNPGSYQMKITPQTNSIEVVV